MPTRDVAGLPNRPACMSRRRPGLYALSSEHFMEMDQGMGRVLVPLANADKHRLGQPGPGASGGIEIRGDAEVRRAVACGLMFITHEVHVDPGAMAGLQHQVAVELAIAGGVRAAARHHAPLQFRPPDLATGDRFETAAAHLALEGNAPIAVEAQGEGPDVVDAGNCSAVVLLCHATDPLKEAGCRKPNPAASTGSSDAVGQLGA